MDDSTSSARGLQFPDWLQAQMVRRRLSLNAVALRTGMSPSSLSLYSRGVRLPESANLDDLVSFFGADRAEVQALVDADTEVLEEARRRRQHERLVKRISNAAPSAEVAAEPTLHIGFSAKSTVPADLVSLIETAVKKAVAEAQAEGVNVATPDRPVRILREEDGQAAPESLYNVHETHARASAGEGHEAWDCWPVPLPERVTATNIGLYVVDGDCLSPHVQPGDRLVVDGDASPRDGQVVVVTLGRHVNAKWFKAADDDGDDRLLDNTGRVLRLDDDDVHYRGVVLSVVRPPPERPSE